MGPRLLGGGRPACQEDLEEPHLSLVCVWVQQSHTWPASPGSRLENGLKKRLGEVEDLGKVPEFGEGIGVEDLVSWEEEGKGSGGPQPKSGLKALHSMVQRELEGGGKENLMQLH